MAMLFLQCPSLSTILATLLFSSIHLPISQRLSTLKTNKFVTFYSTQMYHFSKDMDQNKRLWYPLVCTTKYERKIPKIPWSSHTALFQGSFHGPAWLSHPTTFKPASHYKVCSKFFDIVTRWLFINYYFWISVWRKKPNELLYTTTWTFEISTIK